MLTLTIKEVPKPLLVDVSLNRQPEAALARCGERARVEVRAEDLHGLTDLMTRRFFEQEDRERIGFLAGRTAGDPHAYSLVSGFILEQFRQNILGKFLKRLAVAKKCSHGNQEVAEKSLRLFGAVAHDLIIIRQAIGSDHLHAASDAARYGGTFVFGEVVTGTNTQMRQ